MTTIKVLGRREEGLKAVNFGAEFTRFSVSDAVQISTDRAASDYQVIQNLEKDDVIELIFEEDIHRWVTVAELERDFKNQLPRGSEPGVLEIPSQLPSGDTSRGATSWALKALRVLKFDPVEMVAEKFAETWDKKLMPKPGLYRFDRGLDTHGGELNQPEVKEKKPILLFIHGTFSSTTNGFGGLQPEVWKLLQQKYGDQIFGYDHKTLSLSPIENTLDLVKKLPANAILHVVTHSRGGLIGELLCRSGRKDKTSPFDEDDRKLIAESKESAKALVELSGLLEKKKISVERFVRVACPARGTSLVSKRLDRWLEVIVNVIGKLLPPGAASAYGVLTDLLLELKKQSANPDAIPGLAFMNPESNFIKLINRLDVQLDIDLSVIAGDVEKNDVAGRLAIFFTDLFYTEEHDLVVQTPAMYGGPTRKEGRYFFHKGSEVNHFNYFSNKKTAEMIMEALTLSVDKLGGKGFRPLAEAYVKAVPDLELGSRSYQKRSNLSQPVVYILPGIMGTHLSERGNRIWLDAVDLAQGKMANLRITNKQVEPQALVALAYANLVDYLSATHEVIPFPYDWRLSIMDEAERFANVLEAKLKQTNADQPIRILAHSMGGLVTRAMIGLRADLWQKICERDGARFVMLGTPNRGSYMIPRLIFGQEKTFRMLAMLDLRNSAEQLLEVITRFPGVLQLLPVSEDGSWNFLEAATWDKFPNTGRRKWVKPLEKDLEQARSFHAFLEAGKKKITDWDSIVYVAGYAPRAPVAVEVDENDEIVFRGTNRGDGTVPWESGILPELEKDRTYYMGVPHGDLANHKDSFGAIYDLLNEGVTTRLLKNPPRFDRGQEDRYLLRDEGLEIYPSQLDLETTILGATPILHQAPLTKPVRVSVIHGNLSFCSLPVAVGHYEGDGLYSAEKTLDHHLNGRLSDRLQLGLYPGPEGTVDVVLNDRGKKPRGAIIVGLGKAGELSPNKLSNAFAIALREYGIKALEDGTVGEDGEITISTLLIGTGSTGLSVTNSVDAILSGVIQANKSFAQIAVANRGASHHPSNIHISEIQFVELFKDHAILAVKALQPFRNNNEFLINPQLQSLQGGWKRIAYEEPAGWWTRIHIRAVEKREDSLIFSVPTDRARSEDSRLPVQRPNLDRLIAQAVQNPNWDQGLASAMFELMIPNRIKGSFKDMQAVLFVVDQEAARYPWELLYDRGSGQDLPLVIKIGMIRQFSTASFQERVADVKNINVMVIGNPAKTPSNFSNLPGAEQEATLVASKLEENGFDVQRAIHADSSYIMKHLFSKDYRVLHLAGHGVWEYEYKESEDAEPDIFTGMVLGDGVFLTANEIKQKMHIPELVFINCCHLGKLAAQKKEDKTPKYAYNDFAASLSKELIEMGVKAVVAAGWAVDDAAALTFAEVFYEHLLKGYQFGDAVKEARVETYRLHKDRANTWGAYQCYGDPAYRLVIKTEADRSRKDRFVDIEEAIVKTNQLYEIAKTTSAQGIEKIRNDLKDLMDGIDKTNPTWLEDARLLEALGDAYGEAFWFEEAVKYYDLAITSGKSTAAIRAIERSANCRIRLAVQETENNPEGYIAAKKNIDKQIRKLKQLMSSIGATSERLSMIGSGYKRLAQISSGKSTKDCTAALKEMEKYYDRAWKRNEGVYPLAYPLTNALTATIVQMLRAIAIDISKLPDIRKQIADVENLASKDQLNSSDDFWAATGVTDVKLLLHLYEYMKGKKKAVSGKIHDDLVREYKTAWEQYGSARELNSIIEHYAFLAAVIRKTAAHEDLCDVLEKILGSLKSTYEEVD
jgi:CHAT domain-containing protein/pimeloyl-ACP methyl ester carboxylesterase